jgi:Fic family protein
MEADKINTLDIHHKNQDPISFFEKDASFVFAFKKTEKLVSAIYMVTNLFSDSEPMKWTLRKKSSDLVSFILGYKDIKDSSLTDFSYNIKSRILELVSLLEVSFRAGLISQMNHSIIKHEFNNLSEVFSVTSTTKVSAQENISRSFFNVPDHRISPSVSANPVAHVSEQNTVNHEVNLSVQKTVTESDVFKRYNRQNIILGLLKKKNELTIKDIAMVIKDCSEKTIQRELISFIDAGVLKRTGERRWSKYSLV